MNSFGYIGTDPVLWGVAEDVLVTTSTLQIPLAGSGPLGDGKFLDNSVSFHFLRVYLLSPIAQTLTIDVSDTTASTNLGSFTIAAGSLTASKTVGSAYAISVNDTAFLTLSVASGQVLIPRLHWYTD
jgi:hypothetical protein